MVELGEMMSFGVLVMMGRLESEKSAKTGELIWCCYGKGKSGRLAGILEVKPLTRRGSKVERDQIVWKIARDSMIHTDISS
jgi:hypothetical protein